VASLSPARAVSHAPTRVGPRPSLDANVRKQRSFFSYLPTSTALISLAFGVFYLPTVPTGYLEHGRATCAKSLMSKVQTAPGGKAHDVHVGAPSHEVSSHLISTDGPKLTTGYRPVAR